VGEPGEDVVDGGRDGLGMGFLGHVTRARDDAHFAVLR